MSVLGVDVSHFQGPVDWEAVARSEVRFAYVKATEGESHVDARFKENWSGIAKAGLMRGAYHFAHPLQPAAAQAQHFAFTVGTVARPGDLPPALDLEAHDGLTPAAVIDWVLAFVSHAEALFVRPLVIYTGSLWRHFLGDPMVPSISSRMLWTARYGSHEPQVPKNWDRWSIWQFTDGKDGQVTPIAGISGPHDADRFAGELSDLRALAGLPRNP